MGLFWKSRTDVVEEEILSLIGNLNNSLPRAQNSLVANHGITDHNIAEMINICEEMKKVQDKIQSLSDTLSDAKIANINAPWTDGRYYPLPMWMGYYNLYTVRIKKAMSDYANNF